jgi:Tol biopolymer transport system component
MRLVPLALAVLIAALVASEAGAGFPGRNGLLVVSSSQSTTASGEVYSIGVGGTHRQNLTQSPAPDSEAVWSPGGSQVAFVRDRSIAVMSADGSSAAHLLGPGLEPAWSPDGRRIAFSRNDSIWTESPTGTDVRHLTLDGSGDFWPQWSPDGTRVAFLHGAGFLDVVPAAGGAATDLARGLSYDRQAFVWATDGRSIFYGNAYDLYRVAADGSKDDLLLRVPATVDNLAVSPGGDAVAFSVGPYGSPGSAGVWIYPLAAQTARQLTSSGTEQDSLLTWSPSGGYLGFVQSDDTSIHIVPVDGGDIATLPPEHPTTVFDSLAWSPDGRSLLYTTSFVDDNELYSFRLEEGAAGPQKRLTTNWSQDVDPAWSADGSRIAFASDRSGRFQIYVMRADGSHVRRVTRDSANDTEPAWSPNGARIVFSSDRLVDAKDRSAKSQGYVIAHLWVMNADGSRLRRLTHGRTDDHDPAWSPNGLLIVFSNEETDPPQLDTVLPDGTGRHWTGQTGTDPDWSPNGRDLAFLHVYYPDGFRAVPTEVPPQTELALLSNSFRDLAPLGDHGPARWSPDGTMLATDDGFVLDPQGDVVGHIPAGEASWQPR